MRLVKIIFPLVLAFSFAGLAYGADKGDPKPADEKPADPTGSVSGLIKPPSKEAPSGSIAELQEGAAGGTTYFLFADGSIGKQLKDLAKKGASATVTGVITKDGYHVTQISNVVKPK